MHLSKKNKVVLAWTLPTAAIVVSSAIVTPIIVFNEQKGWNNINQAPNVTPDFSFLSSNKVSNNLSIIDEIKKNPDVLRNNPKNFSAEYFEYVTFGPNSKVKSIRNLYFNFNAKGNNGFQLRKESNGYFWYKNNIKYDVVDVKQNGVNPDYYIFDVTISKSNEGKSKTYVTTLKPSKNSFASSEKSIQNFISIKAEEINRLFKDKLRLVADNNLSSIDQVTKSSDLDIKKSEGDEEIFARQLGNNNDDVYYEAIIDEYKYSSSPIVAYTPIQEGYDKLIFDRENAYKFTTLNSFDTSSTLFTFLKNNRDHLTYLPALTDEEMKGLSSDQQIDRQIQKLIFDPNTAPSYSYDEFGNKVPLNSQQAVVLKIGLKRDDAKSLYTYIVVWSNIFNPTASIIDESPELAFKIKTKPNGESYKYTELNDKNKWPYMFEPETKPKNGLEYKVINVSKISGTEATLSIEVSHPDFIQTKKYDYVLKSGFLSQKYLELDGQIKKVIGDNPTFESLNKLTLNINIKSGSSSDKVWENQFNYEELLKQLDITMSPSVSNIGFKIVSTTQNGTTLIIGVKIFPQSEVDNFWSLPEIGFDGTFYGKLDGINPPQPTPPQPPQPQPIPPTALIDKINESMDS